MSLIWIASDHAGFELKQKIISDLKENFSTRTIVDFGPTTDANSVDYPDFADQVAKNIQANHDETNFGILICGSGQGMAMRANKYSNVRAALVWTFEVAKLSREHNNANILCLGGRVTDHKLAIEMTRLFLQTPFAGGRHASRVAKISAGV